MKKAIILILFPLFIIGGYFLYQNQAPATQPKVQVSPQPEVSGVQLNLEFSENKIEETMDIAEGDTAYSLLQQVAQDKNIELQIKQYDFGVFVQSIGDYESDENMSWIYFVDGQSGSVAADQYKVSPGQLVEWKYLKPTYDE